MNIRYRKQASQDLKNHQAYIKSCNQLAAFRFVDEMNKTELQLLNMPFSGQKLEGGDIRFKQIIDFKIKIFYKLYKNDVVILRLYHFARHNPYQS